MLHRICPCFFRSKSRGQSLKSYDPRTEQEIEQQDFMMQLERESKSTDLQGLETPEAKEQEEKNQETSLDVKLKEQNRIYDEKIKGPTKSHSQQLISMQPQQTPRLKINIPSDSQHHATVSQAVQNMDQLLSIQSSTQVSMSHNKLQINKSKLRVWKKATQLHQHAFVVAYELPCSYSFYNQLMNRHIQSSDKHRFVAQFKLTRSVYPNLGIKYLRLNRASHLGPAEFTYLKYTNASENYHWEVCVSTDSQENTGKNFQQLHSISQVIEQQVETEGNQQGNSENQHKMGSIRLLVKAYISLGAKIDMEKSQKLYLSLKQYVTELWDEASTNYEEEQV